jgi:prevent-host-death family protein
MTVVVCFQRTHVARMQWRRVVLVLHHYMIMRKVSARRANHEFSELLSRVERGEEIVITKRGKPVAVLGPYRPTLVTPERQKAIAHAVSVMAKGLPWGNLRRFLREDMHERSL